jgi:PAS domain S-box-containing protein
MNRRSFFRILLLLALACSATAGSVASNALTPQEKSWLAAHPVIRVAPDPDFPPIEWFDEHGNFTGIAADFLTLIQPSLKLEFRIVRCATWDEVLQKARDHEVDMLSAASKTPQRSEYLAFTEPHIVLPGVIIVRKDVAKEFSIDKLAGMRVCVVSGYLWQEYIARDHPRIIIDPVPNIETGLRKVSFGMADAMIENVATAVQVIEKEGIPNLRVAGETGYQTRLSFATRKDWPELNAVLNKALAGIGADQRKELLGRWIHLGRPRISRGLLAGITIPLICILLVILAVIGWNHSLQRQVSQRTVQIEQELSERKRVEQALRESENKFLEMVEYANSIILRMDVEGTVTFFNRFAELFFGFTKAEILGRNVVGTIVPGVDSTGTDLIAKIRDIGKHPEEYRTTENENMCKDGRRVWVSWSNRPIIDTDRSVRELLCVGNDITPIKQIQMALKRERDFTSAIFDAAGVLVLVLDRDEKIVRFNQTCEKLTGYSFEEVRGKPFGDLFLLPEEKAPVGSRFAQLTAGSYPNEGENFWIAKNGARRLIAWYNTVISDDRGAVVHIVSTGIDVTEHRRADEELRQHRDHLEELIRSRTRELSTAVEQLRRESIDHKQDEDALRESERRYRFLFEQSPAGNIIIGLDGGIKDINEYFLANLGYTKEEIIGKQAIDFIDPEERERVTDALRERFSGVMVPERDNAVLAKDGSVHYVVFSSGQTQLYEKDRLWAILVTGIDVSDRRKAEELARRQQEQLVQADKMASLGILVSGVAHEINNPNNFIILNSDNLRDIWKDLQPKLDRYRQEHGEFLLAGLPYDDIRGEIEQLISGIGEGAKRIRNIVQGLKDFARQEQGDLDQRVDVNEVLKAATLILSNLIRKSTDRFVYDLQPDLPAISGSFQRIEQVMINLITNACQALTNRKQSIVLTTRFLAHEGRLTTTIRDEGMGISVDDQKHIMDPFFTTKRDSGGTGLGLSISYSIVKEHRGELRIESTPGAGTCVTVDLPAEQPPA